MKIHRVFLIASVVCGGSGCFTTNNKIGGGRLAPPAERASEIVTVAIQSNRSYLDEKQEFHRCCVTRSAVRVRPYGISFQEAFPTGTTKRVRVGLEKPLDVYDHFNVAFGLCLGPFAMLGGYKGDMLNGYYAGTYFSKSKDALLKTLDAHNALVRWSHEEGDAAFVKKASDWRSATPRPALSEEGDRHRILAENAFREKNLDSVIDHYELALDSDPTWPDGNFNLALLLGDAKEYKLASFFMKRYLLLVPDSKDAQGAKEKIVIWDSKAESKH